MVRDEAYTVLKAHLTLASIERAGQQELEACL